MVSGMRSAPAPSADDDELAGAPDLGDARCLDDEARDVRRKLVFATIGCIVSLHSAATQRTGLMLAVRSPDSEAPSRPVFDGPNVTLGGDP